MCLRGEAKINGKKSVDSRSIVSVPFLSTKYDIVVYTGLSHFLTVTSHLAINSRWSSNWFIGIFNSCTESCWPINNLEQYREFPPRLAPDILAPTYSHLMRPAGLVVRRHLYVHLRGCLRIGAVLWQLMAGDGAVGCLEST